MGRLFAFREAELKRVVGMVAPVIESRNTAVWRELWPGLALAWDLPRALAEADLVTGSPVEPWLPVAGSKEHLNLLRVLARRWAVGRVELQESRWHVAFPELTDDVAGIELDDSKEYAALGEHLFTAGAMPSGLRFLDEAPDVTTNWVSAESVARLSELERKEGFLRAAGTHMTEAGYPLGADFLRIHALLELAGQNGWALYLWDPGS